MHPDPDDRRDEPSPPVTSAPPIAAEPARGVQAGTDRDPPRPHAAPSPPRPAPAPRSDGPPPAPPLQQITPTPQAQPDPPAPKIEIRIGRVEVAAPKPPPATPQQAPRAAPARPMASAPSRGLTDYLGWKR